MTTSNNSNLGEKCKAVLAQKKYSAIKSKIRYHHRQTSSNLPNGKQHTIVLIGWMGSQERFLKKFVDFYVAAGHDVVTLIPTPLDCFVPYVRQGTVRIFLEALSDLIAVKAEYNESTKLVWHIFSNNGGFFTADCMQIFNGPSPSKANNFAQIRDNIHGFIIDSCPSEFNWKIGVEAFRLAVRPNAVVYALFWLFMLVYGIVGAVLDSLRGKTAQDLYWDSLASGIRWWPYLVAYSSQDKVVPPQHVEQFLDRVKKAAAAAAQNTNTNIDTNTNTNSSPHQLLIARWDDCQHVELFRTHPDEYRDTVLNFIASHARHYF
eukprot:GEZU01025119.1.p1 GENE.GEZU01025119.1~~GEZU01025119.1.p1  ORF type:complete len:319 (+),score=89.23 GEZU01025119.1:143-1099(+)